jgi:prolyl-tRNA editing enzyme YbaK/EbsC (Cys-tRNA(Pro) deacylase)
VEPWPEPVERVVRYLREAGAEARVEEFAEGTPTAVEAARAIGCDLAAVVKSLVFVCDGKPVVALVPGDRRADARKLAAAAGAEQARVARPDEVRSATGFDPGAVAPFPLPLVDRIYIERSLLVHERVWVGAGSSRHMAGLPPPELVRVAPAQPLDAVEEPSPRPR